MAEPARASRLRLIVNKGREHGLQGVDPADAYEEIEAAIWDGGALPADRPSQRRAWSTTLAMAKRAYDEGVSNTLSKLAIEAVSATDDGAEPLKLVAKAAVGFASDQDIVDAVREALIADGRAEDVLHFPFYFVREARAEKVRSQAEIDRLTAAAERDVRELAEYRAERDAQEIMASLPEGSTIAEFQAAIRTSHPLISEAVAASCAEHAARALSAQPLPAWRLEPTDPFGRLPDEEQDRKNQALHERAAMLARGLPKNLDQSAEDHPAEVIPQISPPLSVGSGLTSVGARPIAPTPFILRDPAKIPRREWLYGRHLIRGEIGLTLAPGGVGKTSLSMAEAVSLVSGRKLLHDDPGRKYRVWLWNGEEPDDELERRIAAIALHYGLGSDDFGDRLHIDSGNGLPLVLAEQSREGTRVHAPVVDRLVEALQERQIDVMLIDPFVSTHNVIENDNGAIQRAASAWKSVAHRAGVAVGLAHHTKKLGGREATAEDSRGGDALVAKARDARALNPMSAADARSLGVPGHKRASFFYTGPGGKSNMSPKTDQKKWFELKSVGLGNGGGLSLPQDTVAVVTPWSPPAVSEALDLECVKELATIMAGEDWRAPPQAWKRENWVGRAIAEAFELGTDEGFEVRAKQLQATLEKEKWLVRADVSDRNRNIVKVSRFSPQKLAEFSQSA